MFNLQIERLLNNEINGTLKYISNDSIPDAIMVFQGLYIPSSYQLILIYERWVSQPPDIEINLVGIYDDLSDTISGEVSGTPCTGADRFNLTRDAPGLYYVYSCCIVHIYLIFQIYHAPKEHMKAPDPTAICHEQ